MSDFLNQNKLYSISEASRQLGLGKSTLYDLIAVGKIGTLTIGKRKKVPQVELEKFIHDNTLRNTSNDNCFSLTDVELHFMEKQRTETEIFLKKLKEEFK